MTKARALERFKNEVCLVSQSIDPGDEFDWFSLSIGFFLALGFDFESAHDLALDARYTHHYWMA